MIILISGINTNNEDSMNQALRAAGYGYALDRTTLTTGQLDIRGYTFRQYAGIEEADVLKVLSDLADLGLDLMIAAGD